MKLTKAVLEWDNGATMEYADPKGLDIGDLLGIGEIKEAGPDTLAGLISTVLTGAIGLLVKKFGLSI